MAAQGQRPGPVCSSRRSPRPGPWLDLLGRASRGRPRAYQFRAGGRYAHFRRHGPPRGVRVVSSLAQSSLTRAGGLRRIGRCRSVSGGTPRRVDAGSDGAGASFSQSHDRLSRRSRPSRPRRPGLKKAATSPCATLASATCGPVDVADFWRGCPTKVYFPPTAANPRPPSAVSCSGSTGRRLFSGSPPAVRRPGLLVQLGLAEGAGVWILSRVAPRFHRASSPHPLASFCPRPHRVAGGLLHEAAHLLSSGRQRLRISITTATAVHHRVARSDATLSLPRRDRLLPLSPDAARRALVAGLSFYSSPAPGGISHPLLRRRRPASSCSSVRTSSRPSSLSNRPLPNGTLAAVRRVSQPLVHENVRGPRFPSAGWSRRSVTSRRVSRPEVRWHCVPGPLCSGVVWAAWYLISRPAHACGHSRHSISAYDVRDEKSAGIARRPVAGRSHPTKLSSRALRTLPWPAHHLLSPVRAA